MRPVGKRAGMNQPMRMPEIATRRVGIRIEDVNLSYGTHHVLKDVNLEIRPGEFFAFLMIFTEGLQRRGLRAERS
jgi:ABC-type multidrug transport system fused ATPase/permease subunit